MFKNGGVEASNEENMYLIVHISNFVDSLFVENYDKNKKFYYKNISIDLKKLLEDIKFLSNYIDQYKLSAFLILFSETSIIKYNLLLLIKENDLIPHDLEFLNNIFACNNSFLFIDILPTLKDGDS